MTPPQSSPPEDGSTPQARVLEDFLGYVVRRASLAINEHFMARMQPHGLRPLTFTLLLLIRSNPGITSSQLCGLLDLQSSNVVGLIRELEARGLIGKQAHPLDKRAWGLHLMPEATPLLAVAETDAHAADAEAVDRLTPQERQTLHRLLQKSLGMAPT